MKTGRILAGVLFLIAGGFLAFLAGREVSDRLGRSAGEEVHATVTEKRVSEKTAREGGGFSWEIRYRFDLPGGTFTAGDATGRTNLYVGIDGKTWEGLAEGSLIPVRYEKARPGNNRPLDARSGWGDLAAGGFLALAFLGGGVLLLRPPKAKMRKPFPHERFLDDLRSGRAYLTGGATSDSGWSVHWRDGRYVKRVWNEGEESEEILDEAKVIGLLVTYGPGIFRKQA